MMGYEVWVLIGGEAVEMDRELMVAYTVVWYGCPMLTTNASLAGCQARLHCS